MHEKKGYFEELNTARNLISKFETNAASNNLAVQVLVESVSLLTSFFNSPGAMRGVVEVERNDIRHIVDNYITAEFFGRTQESMSYMLASLMGVKQKFIDTWIKHYEESKLNKQPVHFEYEHISNNQTYIFSVTVNYLGESNSGFSRYSYALFDITEHKRIEAELKRAQAELESRVEKRTKELRGKTIKLEETNIALNILLKKRQEDKTYIEEKVLANVKDLIFPFIEKIKKTELTPRQEAYLGIIEANLRDIISPFSIKLSSKYFSLTPAEIQIVEFIKQGKTTKEIAELLNLSYRTICFHRQNIRKKLNLSNQKTNLRTFLLSF